MGTRTRPVLAWRRTWTGARSLARRRPEERTRDASVARRRRKKPAKRGALTANTPVNQCASRRVYIESCWPSVTLGLTFCERSKTTQTKKSAPASSRKREEAHTHVVHVINVIMNAQK